MRPVAEDRLQMNSVRLVFIFVVNLCSPFGLLLVCLLVTIKAYKIWPLLHKNEVSRSTQGGYWERIPRGCGLFATYVVRFLLKPPARRVLRKKNRRKDTNSTYHHNLHLHISRHAHIFIPAHIQTCTSSHLRLCCICFVFFSHMFS